MTSWGSSLREQEMAALAHRSRSLGRLSPFLWGFKACMRLKTERGNEASKIALPWMLFLGTK